MKNSLKTTYLEKERNKNEWVKNLEQKLDEI